MKKRTRKRIMWAAVAAGLIIAVVSYNYSLDQTRLRGQAFGNEIAQIQDDLKAAQSGFGAIRGSWQDGQMGQDEFLTLASEHVAEMEGIISRYDSLEPPAGFGASVELLRLSTVTQLEAEELEIEWIRTGNESYRIRSDALYQEAFEYELAGLSSFNSAKTGAGP